MRSKTLVLVWGAENPAYVCLFEYVRKRESAGAPIFTTVSFLMLPSKLRGGKHSLSREIKTSINTPQNAQPPRKTTLPKSGLKNLLGCGEGHLIWAPKWHHCLLPFVGAGFKSILRESKVSVRVEREFFSWLYAANVCVHAHFWAAGEKVTKTWVFCPSSLFSSGGFKGKSGRGGKKNFTKIGGSVST